jgi:lipopolysaccharide export system permease protein
MHIFTRYLLRQATGALLLILLSLAGIAWIALALRELNVVTSDRQDAFVLLKMTTLALPNLMVMIAPFALLISVIHVLNRLNGDSELIVHTSGGGTIWAVARPMLILATIVACVLSVFNHVVMPWSLKSLRATVLEVRSDLLTQVIQPGRFSSVDKGLTFHIRDRDFNGELNGLVMHDARKRNERHSYLAERGVIVKQDQSAYLVMSDGHIVRKSGDQMPQIIKFDRYVLDLNTFESTTTSSRRKAREQYTHELRDPKVIAEAHKRDRAKFVPEFHERFAGPLYPFAFVLIALATIGNAQSTRQNRNEKLVLGLVAASGVRLVGLAFNNVVAVSPNLFFVLYLLPLSAIVLALVAMFTGAKPKVRNQRLEAVHDWLLERFATIGRWILQRPKASEV